MNWLGKLIKQHVDKNDTVLDLGCGIMQATTNILEVRSLRKPKGLLKSLANREKTLECKTILGVELVDKYLDRIKTKYPTIKTDVRNTELFVDNSFDVVICTDVLEHLVVDDAIILLKEMKRIARKKVVIYTPLKWNSNGDNVENAWGMGENKLQGHKSVIPIDVLHNLSYTTTLTEIDGNIFGVYTK